MERHLVPPAEGAASFHTTRWFSATITGRKGARTGRSRCVLARARKTLARATKASFCRNRTRRSKGQRTAGEVSDFLQCVMRGEPFYSPYAFRESGLCQTTPETPTGQASPESVPLTSGNGGWQREGSRASLFYGWLYLADFHTLIYTANPWLAVARPA